VSSSVPCGESAGFSRDLDGDVDFNDVIILKAIAEEKETDWSEAELNIGSVFCATSLGTLWT